MSPGEYDCFMHKPLDGEDYFGQLVDLLHYLHDDPPHPVLSTNAMFCGSFYTPLAEDFVELVIVNQLFSRYADARIKVLTRKMDEISGSMGRASNRIAYIRHIATIQTRTQLWRMHLSDSEDMILRST